MRIEGQKEVVTAHSLQNPVFQLMMGHLEDVAVELFEAYGIPARKSETELDAGALSGKLSVLAVMGFVGEGVRGALVMIAPESTVLAWLDAMGETGGDCADVLGEFANMLLGRLKTRLLPEGLPLQISTPTTASGNLRLSVPPALSKWIVLEGTGWQLKIRFDTTFEPRFALAPAGAADAAPAQAGDAIFF